MGKTVSFPNDITFILKGDTVKTSSFLSEYKILSILKENSCLKCQLRNYMWQIAMEKFSTICEDLNVDISLIIVAPKNMVDSLSSVKIGTDFLFPILIDSDGKISEMNNFPNPEEYRTFLLDEDNRVLAIGNPVLNSKTYNLYRQIIEKRENSNTTNKIIPIETTHTVAYLGGIMPQETKTHIFGIRNLSESPLIISKVFSSCHCLEVSQLGDTIPPNSELSLKVVQTADSVPGEFLNAITLYFENYEEFITFVVKGWFIAPLNKQEMSYILNNSVLTNRFLS